MQRIGTKTIHQAKQLAEVKGNSGKKNLLLTRQDKN